MKKHLIWAIIALLLAGSAVVAYGNARAARALALARADSLVNATEREFTATAERDSARAERDSVVVVWSSRFDSQTVAMGRLRVVNRRRTAELDDFLNQPAVVGVPDSFRVLVRETVGGLEDEVTACSGALGACDSLRMADSATIVSLDSTVVAYDSLLVQFQLQLGDAIKAAHPPFFLRARRSLLPAGVGILVGWILNEILGGDGTTTVVVTSDDGKKDEGDYRRR